MSEKFPHPHARPESRESSERVLDVRETADLLFWSFYYSQGYIPLQKQLFEALAQLDPHVSLAPISDHEFLDLEEGRYQRHVLKSPLHVDPQKLKKSEVNSVFLEQLHIMQQAFRSRSSRSQPIESIALQNIIGEMIVRDHKFLVMKGDARPSTRQRPAQGPFGARKSHFVSYVLRGDPCPGPQQFQRLMQTIRAFLMDGKEVGIHQISIPALRELLEKEPPVELDMFPSLKKGLEAE
jgi:hypothetical protein